jgi:peptide methionine sulfoxide reductase msrA/msrB
MGSAKDGATSSTAAEAGGAVSSRLIYLAGGCFWGLERYLKRLPGLLGARVGYALPAGAPTLADLTYERVCYGDTGYAETVEVAYDPQLLPLEVLLELFFEAIDPTTLDRQGPDVGSQYKSAIYYVEEADLAPIRGSLRRLQERYEQPVVVAVVPLGDFQAAEEWHQDYLDKNPSGYCHLPLTKIAQAPDRARELLTSLPGLSG